MYDNDQNQDDLMSGPLESARCSGSLN